MALWASSPPKNFLRVHVTLCRAFRLSAFPSFRRWQTARQATFVMHSTASGPLSSPSETAAAMTGASILIDILANLNRFEARVQKQNARLDGIVQPSLTSAVASSSPVTMPTSICHDGDGEQKRGAEPRRHAFVDGQAYQASVMKLRRALFNFNSRSELAVGKDDDDDDNDAHTASVYPSRPLSRLDVLDSCSEPTAQPPPPRPGLAAADPAPNHHDTGSSHRRPFSGTSDSSLASPGAAVSPAATFTSRRRSGSSSISRWTPPWRGKAPIIAANIKRHLTTRSSRSRRSSQTSTTSSSSARHGGEAEARGGRRRSHRRVEIAMCAYDNFFQSFRSPPRCNDPEAEGTTVKSPVLVPALRRLVRLMTVTAAAMVDGKHEGTAALVA